MANRHRAWVHPHDLRESGLPSNYSQSRNEENHYGLFLLFNHPDDDTFLSNQKIMKPRHLGCIAGFVIALLASDAMGQTNSWFSGMLHPPKVIPALPTNFVVVSASPGTKKSKAFNMYDGVIWSTPATARQYEYGSDLKFSDAHDPLFYVHLSDNVGQQPGTDVFSIEKNLAATSVSAGMKKVKTAKTKWGSYPVLSMTAERPDGSPVFVAWVGINSPDGWTIFIDYRTPHGKGHPTKEEEQVWETLLKDTKPM